MSDSPNDTPRQSPSSDNVTLTCSNKGIEFDFANHLQPVSASDTTTETSAEMRRQQEMAQQESHNETWSDPSSTDQSEVTTMRCVQNDTQILLMTSDSNANASETPGAHNGTTDSSDEESKAASPKSNNNEEPIAPVGHPSGLHRRGGGHFKGRIRAVKLPEEPSISAVKPLKEVTALVRKKGESGPDFLRRIAESSVDTDRVLPLIKTLAANFESEDEKKKKNKKPKEKKKEKLKMGQRSRSVVQQTIEDYWESRSAMLMRSRYEGIAKDNASVPAEVAKRIKQRALADQLVSGDTLKEGIVIGSCDVFATRVNKEFALPLEDRHLEMFLKDPGMFRAVCYRTHCQIEVTRRILNRKLGIGGRWVKYIIIKINGPNFRAIDTCDRMLQRTAPSYKFRKERKGSTHCHMFFSEDTPDNAELYHHFQRTGEASNRYGCLKLNTPYKIARMRTLGLCPWKTGMMKVGKMTFPTCAATQSMAHVFPAYGHSQSKPIGNNCIGSACVDEVKEMQSRRYWERQAAEEEKKAMTVPVQRTPPARTKSKRVGKK